MRYEISPAGYGVRVIIQERIDAFAAFLSRLSLSWPYAHACDQQAMRDAAWWHSQAVD